MVFLSEVPRRELAGIPASSTDDWRWDPFAFAFNPPDRPSQTDEEGPRHPEVGDRFGEAVTMVEEGKMDRELPEGKVGQAEDGSPPHRGRPTVTAEPVKGDRQGRKEAERKGFVTEEKPSLGVEPQKPPDRSVERGQGTRPKEPSAE